jgi:hypothetical protein
VSGDDDDEALTWAGGRDPSHYETPAAKPVKPSKLSKQPDAVAGENAGAGDETALAPVTSGALLVTLGVLAGIYLLYTVGWIITVQHTAYLATSVLDQLAITLKEWFAIAAPALWFAATLFLTRGRRPVVRLLWLVIGALVLVPWPFVLGIANAS